MQADGTRPRLLQGPIIGWRGTWTRDGRFFIFEKPNDNYKWQDDLWLLVDKAGLVTRPPAPLQLTNGPLGFSQSQPSQDGKHIYAIGYQSRGELVRYDPAIKQFLPFLNGISIADAMYSPDGKWVVYLSYPDHSLWRSRADGSDRLQLTYAPMLVFWPHISPNAEQVSFLAYVPKRGWGIYIIQMSGGEPNYVFDSHGSTSWSYDGKSLLVEVPVPKRSSQDADASQLAALNIESQHVAIIANSQGKFGAFQPSPEMIVAGGQQDNLYWCDLPTGKWSILADGPIQDWMLSPDSKYLYFHRGTPGKSAVLKVRLSDRKIENIASLNDFRPIADPLNRSSWVGVTPDGSLLLTRDLGTQEVYRIDLK
jgi:Tol biopolymer transport system component